MAYINTPSWKIKGVWSRKGDCNVQTQKSEILGEKITLVELSTLINTDWLKRSEYVVINKQVPIA